MNQKLKSHIYEIRNKVKYNNDAFIDTFVHVLSVSVRNAATLISGYGISAINFFSIFAIVFLSATSFTLQMINSTNPIAWTLGWGSFAICLVAFTLYIITVISKIGTKNEYSEKHESYADIPEVEMKKDTLKENKQETNTKDVKLGIFLRIKRFINEIIQSIYLSGRQRFKRLLLVVFCWIYTIILYVSSYDDPEFNNIFTAYYFEILKFFVEDIPRMLWEFWLMTLSLIQSAVDWVHLRFR